MIDRVAAGTIFVEREVERALGVGPRLRQIAVDVEIEPHRRPAAGDADTDGHDAERGVGGRIAGLERHAKRGEPRPGPRGLGRTRRREKSHRTHSSVASVGDDVDVRLMGTERIAERIARGAE